jgi:hypothetical protein
VVQSGCLHVTHQTKRAYLGGKRWFFGHTTIGSMDRRQSPGATLADVGHYGPSGSGQQPITFLGRNSQRVVVAQRIYERRVGSMGRGQCYELRRHSLGE